MRFGYVADVTVRVSWYGHHSARRPAVTVMYVGEERAATADDVRLPAFYGWARAEVERVQRAGRLPTPQSTVVAMWVGSRRALGQLRAMAARDVPRAATLAGMKD
jgi:hypothetical protein